MLLQLRCGAPALERYLKHGRKRIDGWLDYTSGHMIGNLSLRQMQLGIQGSLGEIGVHHGLLFILLALSSSPDERLFAVDVFGRQDLNIDKSGKGSRTWFDLNTRAAGIDPAQIHVMETSSLDITGQDILEAVGPVRLMSIDAGHTPECVANDIQLAEVALADGGVAILDDVFNVTWPGVITSLATYWMSDPQLIPFAASPNKVFACRSHQASHYQQMFTSLFRKHLDRSDHLFGFPIDTYGTWNPMGEKRRGPSTVRR
jgi:Methyltransferase domain